MVEPAIQVCEMQVCILRLFKLQSSFSKQSEMNVETQRQFLEKWLVALVDHSRIAASKEIKEFLAYGSSGSMAFLGRERSQEHSKIDKVIIFGPVEM